MAHSPDFQGIDWKKKKHPPLPDGRATPTRQGLYPEMVRLKEA
jgi:hypothetical protein